MLALIFDNETGVADLEWSAGRLVKDRDLETATIVSLFTDAADPEADEREPRRGWWGDSLEPDDPWGSLLWTLFRRKTGGSGGAEAVRRDAERYAREALQWMVAAGIADRVETTAAYGRDLPDGAKALGITVAIYRPQTKDPLLLGPWSILDGV